MSGSLRRPSGCGACRILVLLCSVLLVECDTRRLFNDTSSEFKVAVHIAELGDDDGQLVSVFAACEQHNCKPFKMSLVHDQLAELNVHNIDYFQINDAAIDVPLLATFDQLSYTVDTWALDTTRAPTTFPGRASDRRRDIELFLKEQAAHDCEHVLHDYFEGAVWGLDVNRAWDGGACVGHGSCPTSYAVDLVCMRRQPYSSKASTVVDGATSDHNDGTVSEHIYVLSLQDIPGAADHNAHRFDSFVADWTRVCGPDFLKHVTRCPGNVDDRRGFGVTRTFAQCVEKAWRNGHETAVFMEDDARPFDDQGQTVCSARYRHDLVQTSPRDAMVVLFGAHHISYDISNEPNITDFKHPWRPRTVPVPTFHHLQSLLSFGFYGVAARREMLKFWRATLLHDLSFGPFGTSITLNSTFHPLPEAPDQTHSWRNHNSDFLSPDVSVYGHALSSGRRVYVADPLVIVHISGISNTWQKKRNNITGRDNYITYSTPVENGGKSCRVSDPIYNLTRRWFWPQSKYHATFEDALSTCSKVYKCGGVMEYNRHPGVKRRFNIFTEPASSSIPDWQADWWSKEQQRIAANMPVAEGDYDTPLTFATDPFNPCRTLLQHYGSSSVQVSINPDEDPVDSSMATELHVAVLRQDAADSAAEHASIGSTVASANCQPGYASPTAWEGCVDVNSLGETSSIWDGTDRRQSHPTPCQIPAADLLDKFAGYLRTLSPEHPAQYGKYVDELLRFGHLDNSTISKYKAHLAALRELCMVSWTPQNGSIGFGLVLEPNARATDEDWKLAFPAQHGNMRNKRVVESPLMELMRHRSYATVFNLGPNSDLCEQPARSNAWERGVCTLPAQAQDDSTLAIGYNLAQACSSDFLELQESLVGCVPPEFGLFGSVNGHVALSATVPFFEETGTVGFNVGEGDIVFNATEQATRGAKKIQHAAQWLDFVVEKQGDCLASESNDLSVNIISSGGGRCGVSFGEANSKCGDICTQDSNCSFDNERCFHDVGQAPCQVGERVEVMTKQQQLVLRNMHEELLNIERSLHSNQQQLVKARQRWHVEYRKLTYLERVGSGARAPQQTSCWCNDSCNSEPPATREEDVSTFPATQIAAGIIFSVVFVVVGMFLRQSRVVSTVPLEEAKSPRRDPHIRVGGSSDKEQSTTGVSPATPDMSHDSDSAADEDSGESTHLLP